MSVSHEVDVFFFFQAEDGIRDLVRSRGLGDVYKRQCHGHDAHVSFLAVDNNEVGVLSADINGYAAVGNLSLIHI